MLPWNWLRNNSHYLLMLNHCLHSWRWQERWVAVFWFDLNKERGGDQDIAEFNFLFDCSLLRWLQIFFSLQKKCGCVSNASTKYFILYLQLQNVFIQFWKLHLYTECLHRPRLKVPWPNHDQVSSDPAAPPSSCKYNFTNPHAWISKIQIFKCKVFQWD